VLCTGEIEDIPSYKGNKFHRIIPNFMMQGGDTTEGNGTGGKSIYGNKFNDEGVWLPHTHKGILSMANSGPNTNGSQFFVCYNDTPHLNEKHTVYGRVIHGWGICETAEYVEKGANDKPLSDVTIVDCGELTGEDKLNLENADFIKTYTEEKVY
jgi:cyclophilin family peptidyl-prolyl cis-trans isomerase